MISTRMSGDASFDSTVARAGAALLRRHNFHVMAFERVDDLGEQNVILAVPHQARGVRKHQSSLAAQHWREPRIPSETGRDDRIRDPRAIRRSYRAHFGGPVMRERDGFAVRQQLDIYFTWGKEGPAPSNEGQHVTIG